MEYTPQSTKTTPNGHGASFNRVASLVIRTALGSYYACAGRDGRYTATRADSLDGGTYAPLTEVDFRNIPHIVEVLQPGKALRVRGA